MEPRPISYISEACHGELLSGRGEVVATGISTDSRKITRGDVFFAIRGDKFDGHDFLEQVAKAGASALVVDRGKAPKTTPSAVIAVNNTRVALGEFAKRYRRDFKLKVVAVCGSNGKTTTKELLASILKRKLSVQWSEASFNNDIGVPITLLGISDKHGAAVLEAGTNHPGELKPLLEMIQPEYGVLTSIGREHLEFFRDVSGVAQEEGTLAEVLPADGRLFLNGDSDWAEPIARRCKGTTLLVGVGKGSGWRVGDVLIFEDGTRFKVLEGKADYRGEYMIRIPGRHQVMNAALALAVAAELGISAEEARRGLAECKPAKMRMQIWEVNGVRVLDDCYNANADSMVAALETLRDFACKGKKVAVLGDMAELGEHSATAHAEIGERAAQFGIDLLIAIGKWAAETASAAKAAGISRVEQFADVKSAATAVKKLVKPGDLVLLKASRSAAFERVGEALRSAAL